MRLKHLNNNNVVYYTVVIFVRFLLCTLLHRLIRRPLLCHSALS